MAETREYNVDKILDDRLVKGKTEYKIQWEDFGEEFATWERAENITEGLDELVAEYIARKSGDGAQIRNRRRSRAAEPDQKALRRAIRVSSPGPVKKAAASSKASAAAAKAEAPKTPRGRGKAATAAATAAAAAAAATKVATPVAASTPSKKAPVTPRAGKSASKKAAETPVAAAPAAAHVAAVAASPAAAAAPSKTAAVGVASALNAQSDFDGNTLVPVLVSALWIAGVVNFGLTVACKSKASIWFAATAAVMYAVSSVMFGQYAQKSGDAEHAARVASSWCRLVHALATVATVAYHVTRLGANVWQSGSTLHVHLLNIGFGFAAQEVLAFGAHLSVFRLCRAALEAVLFSAAALCSVPNKNELLLFLFFVLCALRVADALTASAIVCAHKASARLMYAAGVTLLLAALVYFVAYVGPAPAVMNANKLAVFGAFFAAVFFYAAPGETGLF